MSIKLLDLSPRWIMRDGVKVAIVFRCPCCMHSRRPVWISCGFVPMSIGEQIDLFIDEMDMKGQTVIPFKESAPWRVESPWEFHMLTIKPSIDASKSGDGHWHGHIYRGEIA